MKTILCSIACAAALAPSLLAATVSGNVGFATKRGQHPVPTETLMRLEPAGNMRVSRPVPGTFEMVTRGKMLLPHVLAIPAGSTVSFPNDDPISHNLFSLSSANPFDLGLYRKGAGKSQRFDTPGIVNVYCNVHPNMSAVILVLDTPYYAFADASGNYSIANVPPGRYRLVAWNEQGGETETPIDVTSSGAVGGQIALTIDSRNYRVTQHLNKLGKPYEAPSLKDY
jgi:polysaccharide lyase family 4-like protein